MLSFVKQTSLLNYRDIAKRFVKLYNKSINDSYGYNPDYELCSVCSNNDICKYFDWSVSCRNRMATLYALKNILEEINESRSEENY